MKATVDKARMGRDLARNPGTGSDGRDASARGTDAALDGPGRERRAWDWRKSLALAVCLPALIAAIVAAAMAYGHYTTACYAQLVSSVDRNLLADVIRTAYSSSRWQFTRWAVIVVFGVLCAFLFARQALSAGNGTGSRTKKNMMALACLSMFVVSIYPSPLSWVGPRQQIFGTLIIAAIGLAVFGFVTYFRAAVAKMLSVLRRLLFDTRVEMVMLAVFISALAMSTWASYRLFDHVPHVQDSIDQLFQAKIFINGGVYVPSPTPRASFDFLHMINNGHWYSQYPPGHSLLLALGLLVNAPWLVNPLLGALCCLLMYPLGKEMFDERTGRLAMLLAVLSPFLIFMSSEFMNHIPTLLCWQLGMLGFVRMVKYRRMPDALLAGAGFGYAYLIRPLTILAMTAPLLLYLLVNLKAARVEGQSRSFLKVCLASGGMAAVFLGLTLLYNQMTNGSPWLSGYEVCWGKGHLPGFGHAGWGPPHTPELGWIQTLANLNEINLFLFGWPVPALLLVSLGLAFGNRRVWDYVLITTVGAVGFTYFFYFYQDACLGPRQIFECSAALVLLTARFFTQVSDICSRLFAGIDRGVVDGCALFLSAACVVFGIYGHVMSVTGIYGNAYWGTDTQTVKAVKKLGIHHAVVFMKSNFGCVFAENSPQLNSDIVYARDCGTAVNARVARHFPGRSLFIADGQRVEPYQRASNR